MSRENAIFLSLVLGALVCAGCSGTDEVEENAGQGQGRFGLVSVSYDHDWAETGESVALATTAQFVRYTAMDRDHVARLLALPLDPQRDLPPSDQCRVSDLSVDLETDPAEEEIEETGSVELLEAGTLSIQTEKQTVSLAPRHFPWLLPFISGVIYGEAQATLVERAAGVRVAGEGSEAVGPFVVQGGSPDLPRLLKVGGADPSRMIGVPRQQPLALRWQTPSGSSSDVTYVEVRYVKGKRDLALRCQLRDDGAFEIPAPFLGEIAGKASLEIARLRAAAFSATGLERGELRVTVRDQATLLVQ